MSLLHERVTVTFVLVAAFHPRPLPLSSVRTLDAVRPRRRAFTVQSYSSKAFLIGSRQLSFR